MTDLQKKIYQALIDNHINAEYDEDDHSIDIWMPKDSDAIDSFLFSIFENENNKPHIVLGDVSFASPLDMIGGGDDMFVATEVDSKARLKYLIKALTVVVPYFD